MGSDDIFDASSSTHHDISSISIRTNKLILSADDANKEFKTYLDAFKQTIQELDIQRQEINPELRFAILGEQISEITKLMQESNNASKNLNNAFIYLADWVDATGTLLNTMQFDLSEIKNNKDDSIAIKIIQNSVENIVKQISTIEDTIKCVSGIEDIAKEVSGIENLTKQVKGIEQAFNDYKNNDLSVLKEAVSYLITKLDELDENINRKEIEENQESDNIGQKINQLREDFAKFIDKVDEMEQSFSDFKTDDISEIKSSLTGIMVQLNTALTPDIDSLNERIDKLTEQQNNKMSELETLLQEKINIQEKQINNLENKVEELTSKIDKLIVAMGEENTNDETKDMLNYLITQISAMNENISNQQNVEKTINSIDEKVNSFDENINKIVSYIEEE